MNLQTVAITCALVLSIAALTNVSNHTYTPWEEQNKASTLLRGGWS